MIRIKYVIFFAAVVRIFLLYSSYHNNFNYLSRDSSQYIENALTIINYGSFSHSMEKPQMPEVIRTPGYPLFIAIFYKLFGVYDIFVIIGQILISLCSVFLIYRIIKEISSRSLGVIGAMIFSIEPLSLSLIFYLLTETLFQFLILLFIYSSIKVLKKEITYFNLFTIGFVLSLSAITRPVALYLSVPMLFGILAFLYKSRINTQIIINNVIMFLIPIILILGGWTTRNYFETGRLTFSQLKALNLIYFKAPAVLSLSEEIPFEDARRRILNNKDIWKEIGDKPTSDQILKWEDRSIKIITQHPFSMIKIMSIGIINTLIGPGDGLYHNIFGIKKFYNGPFGDLLRLSLIEYKEKWIDNNLPVFVIFSFSLWYLIFIYFGLINYIWLKLNSFTISWIEVFLFFLITYFLITSGGIETYFRFRAPVIPIIIIFSVQGWCFFYKHLSNNTNANILRIIGYFRKISA